MKILFNMKMSEGGSFADHLNDFNTVTNQLSSVKVDFDVEVRDILILCSFPERLNGLVMAVRLQRSKETKRWIAREKPRSKCSR
jgi:hypothetical protein